MKGIKKDHLRLYRETEDPDAFIRAGNRAFCLDSVAVEGVTQDLIKSWYSMLYETVEMYDNEKDNMPKEDLKSGLENIVDNVLDIYEFQAACFVVKEFEKETTTGSLMYEFLDSLYENKDKFIFFEDREKVIDTLYGLGAIKLEKYKKID